MAAVGVRAWVAAGLVALTLAACGRGEPPSLMNLRAGSGPDEFAVIPPKPLEMPADLAALPEPTPGGGNRTDQNPFDDAVAALGGRPGAGTTDGGLVGYAARYGVTPDIRTTLAAEDAEFRSRNRGRPLERLFNVNVYYKAYQDQSLDQHAELEYWRRRGAATPSAPPEGIEPAR